MGAFFLPEDPAKPIGERVFVGEVTGVLLYKTSLI